MRQFILKTDNQWPTHYAAMRDVVGAVSDLFGKKFLTDDENVWEPGLAVLNELTKKGRCRNCTVILSETLLC